MSESQIASKEMVSIGLLGASFDTGNMGVNALAESTVKCILRRWPNAQITLLDSGNVPGEHQLKICGRDILIKKLPVRFCKNIFLENHFLVLCFYAILFKVLRGERLKHFCARRNRSLNNIIQMDIVGDITGGDSFSDIYGMRRFTLGFLRKWLVLLFNKDLIMLPQTYGPFKRPLARTMARFILNHATKIYSRDQAGIGYVNGLLGRSVNGKVKFVPDVALVLDSRKPDDVDSFVVSKAGNKNTIVVGLNISGLLFNGGYTRDNMFGLKVDYQSLIYAIIDWFMKNENVVVVLIPHVFPSTACEVESDPAACLKVYESVKDRYADRLFVIQRVYDQNEIKYIIGTCDFVVASRMHACLAALSQGIPAVGIAYSKKFIGVFESMDLCDCVADAQNCGQDEIVEKIRSTFQNAGQIRQKLQQKIPQLQNEVLDIFRTIELRTR